jgi:FkbM family methyltransferase
LPDTGLRAAVTAKAHAAANRSNPLVQRASSLISHDLGRRLVAGWFGGSIGIQMRDHEAVVRIGGRDLTFGTPNLNIRFDCRYFFAFEPGLLYRISTFEPEERFLDIGANIGRYTVLAAGLRGVRVDAIEPFARNAEELTHNVSRNGLEELVTLHRVAVSDQTGTGCVAYDDEPAGSTDQSIADRPGIDPRPGAKFHETIEVWRVDDMVSAGRIPFPNRIKIDMDGVEHKVLDGMTGILSDPRLKSIRIEIRLEDPLNQAALKRTLGYGFVAQTGDDPKNLDLTRPDGWSGQ